MNNNEKTLELNEMRCQFFSQAFEINEMKKIFSIQPNLKLLSLKGPGTLMKQDK